MQYRIHGLKSWIVWIGLDGKCIRVPVVSEHDSRDNAMSGCQNSARVKKCSLMFIEIHKQIIYYILGIYLLFTIIRVFI